MSQVLENLKQIIIQANVSEEDKNDLLVFLPIFPENLIIDLINCFQKQPKLIKEFNANFKSKLQALTGTSEKEWDEIMQKEEDKKISEGEEEDVMEEE